MLEQEAERERQATIRKAKDDSYLTEHNNARDRERVREEAHMDALMDGQFAVGMQNKRQSVGEQRR
jgi:hypothetical protein